MSYVLVREVNGNKYYGKQEASNAVKKVSDIEPATKFSTQEEAQKLRKYASKKLKNFKIHSIEKAADPAPEEAKEDVAEKVPEKKAAVKMTSQRRCFSQNERTAVYNKSEGRCAICGKFVPFESFTVDHIIPLAKGGSNDMSNLQCACKTCNRIKQDILPEELMDKLTEIMLYQVTMKKNKKYKKTLRKACKKNK